jgi:CheY-like chemotaxis protein
MEDGERVFANILDDLASGEPILQKAALFKIGRFEPVPFQQIAKMIFSGRWTIDEWILKQVFEMQKPKSTSQTKAQEEKYNLQDFANKTKEEVLDDWKNADTRIKLAMLKRAAEVPTWISIRLRKMALLDESALVRLEAENIDLGKKKPLEMDDAEVDALIEKLASENPFPHVDDPFKEKHALIVDDSKTVQHIMKDYLSPHLTVAQAFTSAEALMLVQKVYYDIIFLDIAMAGKSGLDLLGEFRDRGIKSAIIVVSSLSSRHIIQTAFLLGANYFIPKKNMAKILKTDRIHEVLNRF